MEDPHTKLNYKTKIEMYYLNPKLCGNCSCIIPYEKRRNIYCSSSCSATKTNVGIVRNGKKAGTCLVCNKKLNESVRRYCSHSCNNIWLYTQAILAWKAGKLDDRQHLSNYIRKYIFEKYYNKCSTCGWSIKNNYTGNIPLQIHHINGDPLDHREENLVLLCPNCHSLTENFGSRNKGKGRPHRYKK